MDTPVQTEEWYLVPLFIIDEAVARIKDGNITGYLYDPDGDTREDEGRFKRLTHTDVASVLGVEPLRDSLELVDQAESLT